MRFFPHQGDVSKKLSKERVLKIKLFGEGKGIFVEGLNIHRQNTSNNKESRILWCDPNTNYLINDKLVIVLVDIIEIYKIPDSFKPNLTQLSGFGTHAIATK